MSDKPLGRRTPTDWTHVDRHPLTALVLDEIVKPRPVAIGVNWYVEFDRPEQDSDGHWWVARDGKLTTVRGGHCVCLKPRGARATDKRWDFYNQGQEGACVGFGGSHMMTFFNGRLYLARWLWDMAKAGDQWAETNPGDDDGTSVSAAMDVLRTRGHVVYKDAYEPLQTDWVKRDQLSADPREGIKANRWATSIDDVLRVLGYTGLDYVDFVNSWGRDYPRLVRMPATVLERLRTEEGEIAVPTDR